MKNTLFLILFCFIASVANAATCVIYGNSKDYTGQTLQLKTYTDEIVNTEKILATSIVSPDGNFNFEFAASTTMTCFINAGIYQAIIIAAEPGKKHKVQLPVYTPLSKAQLFNPYFSYERILLPIENLLENDVNKQIEKFEEMVDYYSYKLALNPVLDSIQSSIGTLKEEFPTSANSFFEQYKGYRYAQLLNLYEKESPALAVTTYMAKLPVVYENIAFWEAFNTIFNNFFSVFGLTLEQQYINKALVTADLTALLSILEYRFEITDKKLQELVVIKGLHDLFYSTEQNPAYFLTLLKQWEPRFATLENKVIAKNVISKLEKSSSEGVIAFDFTLLDEQDKPHQLSEYRGKYVYLNFCNTDIALSKKDFGILARYAEVYKKDLSIINVFTDEQKQTMKAFVAKLNDKSMVYLSAEENVVRLLEKYNVKNIPTYFLIDREGRLRLSPAPTPDENFDEDFDEILMNEKLHTPEVKNPDAWWE